MPNGSPLFTPVRITHIHAGSGIVYFDNPGGHQIEAYLYSNKRATTTSRTQKPINGSGIYPPHRGKRFIPKWQLPSGATEWAIPTGYFKFQPDQVQGSSYHRRFHFMFGVRDVATGIRGPMSQTVISTATRNERYGGRERLDNPPFYGPRIIMGPTTHFRGRL